MTTPILSARNIEKSFGQMRAMQGASFDIHEGEVVALVGDNGAGKSTLTKILSGVIKPDSATFMLTATPSTSAARWMRARTASKPSIRTCRSP